MPAKPYKTTRMSTPWSISSSSLRAAPSPRRPLPPAACLCGPPPSVEACGGQVGYLLPCSEVPGTEPVAADSGPLGRRPRLEDRPGLCSGCSPASPARGPDRILAAAPSLVPSMSQWRSGSCRRQRGAVVPAAATPGPAGLWCWSPVLCFWPGQGTPVWYLQLGTDGHFLCQCKSSSSCSGGWRSISPGALEAQPCSQIE